MEFNEYARFKELWRAACENALGKPPTEEALSLAFGALAPYSLGDVRKAIIQCLRDSQFKPTPATVRDMLEGGRPEDRARIAYGRVIKALRRIRSGESVRFDDPCIHWALENGCRGWTGFAQMSERDGERAFVEYYITAARSRMSWDNPDVPDHMPGTREQRQSEYDPWTPEQIVEVDRQAAGGQKRLTA